MSEGGAEDDSEKSNDPTPKRLEDARAKGDIPFSADLVTAAAYAGFLLAAMMAGGGSMMDLGTVLRSLLDQPDRLSDDVFAGGGEAFAGGLMMAVAWPALVWFGLPAGLALLAVFGQSAPVFASSKLEPQLSRISPLKALGQKFGLSGLVEFFKSFAKLLIYMLILGIFLMQITPDLVTSVRLAPGIAMHETLALVVRLLTIVVAIAVVLGILDLVWQRLDFLRRHMMSRKELMDEFKESEGDPHFKQQRRQRGVTLAMRQMMADVPKADVVIVNPTHYAVALKWDRSSKGAPICLAKGQDEIALKIRELAMQHGIPIHSDPPTARALHATVEIGQEIPRAQYRAVAAAIRFAERIRRKAGAPA